MLFRIISALTISAILLYSSSCSPKLASVSTTAQTPTMQVDTEYYATVEKPAMFQGGDIKAFDAFVKKNIKYPASALKKKQQGTAYLQFGVSPYGNVNYTYILKSSGSKLLDKEAIRVVHDSPKWIPAQNGNTYVGQLLVIPVEFKLPQPKANKQTKK